MARELSPTLEAQQKYGLITQPYLIAKIRRKWGGVIRYEWENLYSGNEPLYRHRATMPGDGSLVRIRMGDNPAGDYIYQQRIENPNESSDFSAWSQIGTIIATTVAICSLGAEVSEFYRTATIAIYHRQSNDYGATWGAWELIATTAENPITEMDAAYKPNGDICVVYGTANAIAQLRRISGVWQAPAAATYIIYSPCSCSIFYNGDWNVIATTNPTSEVKGVYQAIFGDGYSLPVGTWSDWDAIIERTASEPFTYGTVCVRRFDTTRLVFGEDLTQDEETHYIYYSHSPEAADFVDNAWLEPVPMNVQSMFGVCLTKFGDYAWLTFANKVYRALATDDELDITSKLLIVDIKQQPDIQKGSITITIDNTNGAYNSFARLGDELTIGLGYKTSEGNEYSLASSFWITSYRLESPPWYPLRMIFPPGIIGTLVIEAQDAWDFLKRYKTRRPYSWAVGTKTVLQLLEFFLARAGLTFEVLSSSSAAQNFKPAFEKERGTSYATIVKNLLKMIPDQLIFREYKAILRNPTTAEAVDWIYNNLLGTANLVFRGRYGTSAWDPNRAEVWGDTFMKMGANWPQIGKIRDRLSRVTTPTYPDLTRAEERADAELRRAEVLTGEQSWMDAPTNCGLEPWDKLQITDSIGGVSNIYRRVIRITTHWDAKAYKYHQIITLGAD